MGRVSNVGTAAKWIGISIASAVIYGILNDQITDILSPEYFSVFKRQQFAPILEAAGLMNSPIHIQSLLVGTVATWWFGLILGIVLTVAGLKGSRPPISTLVYSRAVIGIMAFSFALSVLGGLIGYLIEPYANPQPELWPFLEGIHNVRPAFAVGFWHDAAYLGGLIGTIGASIWVWRQRSLKSSP